MIAYIFDINALDEQKLPAEKGEVSNQDNQADSNYDGQKISVNVGNRWENDDEDKRTDWKDAK